MIEYNWFDHILGFILLIGLPVASIRTGSMDEETIELPPKKHLYYTNGLLLFIAASIILTAWNITKRPWYTLGIDWITPSKIAFLALAVVIVVYMLDLWWSVSRSKSDDESDAGMREIIPLTIEDFSHYAFLALAAGVCEEIMYRGFLIPYVSHWFVGIPYASWFGICLPAISFGISHLYQGWMAVSKIIIIGTLLGIIYYYSQSLIIVVILHILIDMVSGYVGMKTLSKTQSGTQSEL